MVTSRTRRSVGRRGVLRPVAYFSLIFATTLLLSVPHHDLVLAALTGLGAAAFSTAWVVKTRRAGQTIRGELAARRVAARRRLDSAEKLHAYAPIAAAMFAGLSLLALPMSLGASGPPGFPGGVRLPSAPDARIQLWVIVIALPATEVMADCWLGRGMLARMLRSDGWTVLAITVTLGLAALPPVLALERVESRPAWLALIAGQFAWLIAGTAGAAIASGVRQERVFPRKPSPESAAWLADNAARSDCQVVLESAGRKPILVAGAVRRSAGVGWKRAMDLTEAVPAVVLRDVSAAEADRARNLLMSRGATVLLR